MEKMKGIYTYTSFLIILMSGLSLSQHYVCLKYKDRGDTIDIICSVDRLRFQITFKNPAGEENGYCGSPITVGNESVFCNGKFNINQNLTTNTTTLNIKKNEFIYGEWKCNHGTNFGFDSLDIKMPSLLTVDISPTVGDVLEGDNQTITCTVSGRPVATVVSWTKSSNGGFETIDRTAVPEKYLGGTNENPTLVITNFTTSDTGTYICKATNVVGTASSQPAVLTCKRKTTIAMSPEGSIWIGLGGTTKLTANITTTSVDPIKIYWQRVENNIARNIVLNTIKYSGSSHEVPVPVLVMNDVDKTDAGLYQIKVTTITGSFIGPRVAVEVIGDIKDSNSRWEIIIPLIIVITILIVPTCFGVYNFVVYIKGKEESVLKCALCSENSICAICIDCKKMFCEICCNTHNRSNPQHNVFITGHAKYEVNCEYCSNMATIACLHCCVVFCNDCEREHLENNHNTKMLIKSNGVVYRRGNMEGTSKLEHKYTSGEQVELVRIGQVRPINQHPDSSTAQQSECPLIQQSGSSTV